MRAAEQMGINVFFQWTPPCEAEFVLNIEPYSTLRTGTKWTGAWWIDTLLDNVRFNTEFSYIDTIFLAGNSHRIEPRDNHRLLFQAADSEIHRPVAVEKDCDFILAGSMGLDIYREREAAIKALRSEGFVFVGAGKDFAPNEYVKQLNRAKVQFIRSMDVDGHGEVAQRFFECLAIGPVLTNWTDDLVHTGLVEGVDYLAYRTIDELVQKMHMLVDDHSYAQKIAENGRYKSRLYHTYQHRVLTIMEVIREYSLP